MTGAGFLRGYFCEVDFIKPLNQMMMKNVLILLFFFSGFATTTLQAQSCCLPCPPECCVQMGCVPGAANATSTNAALWIPDFSKAIASGCSPKKVSKQDIKACQARCQPSAAIAPADQAHVATVPVSTPQNGMCQKSNSTNVVEKTCRTEDKQVLRNF
jgi:hypothetical protein